jgi:cytoskeleton protein RodZ
MDEIESLGRYLKRERELRKISLRDVARNTRVRESFIEALEEDRMDLLPAPIFVKGFLQSYAKYVGLDSDAVLLRFRTLLKGNQEAPQAEPPGRAFSINKNWWVAGGGVLAVIFGIILIFFGPFGSRSPQPETNGPIPAGKEPAVVARTETSSPKEQAPAAMKKAAAASAAEATPQTEEKRVPSPGAEKKLLSVGIKAVEKTWLHIQSSESPDMDAILQPGENLSLRDGQRIEMRIGNAGGVDLTFNGTALEKLGTSGEVVTVIFTPQGVETTRHEKPRPAE